MSNTTLIAYGATILGVVLTLTELVQLLIGAVFGRVLGTFFAAVLGSFLAWGAIDLLWVTYEGGHVPIFLLGAAMAYTLVRGLLIKSGSREPAVAESTVLVILVGYIILTSNMIRWY